MSQLQCQPCCDCTLWMPNCRSQLSFPWRHGPLVPRLDCCRSSSCHACPGLILGKCDKTSSCNNSTAGQAVPATMQRLPSRPTPPQPPHISLQSSPIGKEIGLTYQQQHSEHPLAVTVVHCAWVLIWRPPPIYDCLPLVGDGQGEMCFKDGAKVVF